MEDFSGKLVSQVFRGARVRAGEATTRSKPRPDQTKMINESIGTKHVLTLQRASWIGSEPIGFLCLL